MLGADLSVCLAPSLISAVGSKEMPQEPQMKASLSRPTPTTPLPVQRHACRFNLPNLCFGIQNLAPSPQQNEYRTKSTNSALVGPWALHWRARTCKLPLSPWSSRRSSEVPYWGFWGGGGGGVSLEESYSVWGIKGAPLIFWKCPCLGGGVAVLGFI